jgi:uncharacterized membrane protein
MLDITERLNNLESRLLSIELKLGIAKEAVAAPRPAAATAPRAGAPVAPGPTPDRPPAEPNHAISASLRAAAAQASPPRANAGDYREAPRRTGSAATSEHQPETTSITQLMAWSAGFALLLAAVYFLKLVYDVGWLTPERQLGLATLAGVGLIAAGIVFARVDRAYAAFLPALGLVILYLSGYTGHLYYHLLSSQEAIAAISAITLVGIWLGRRFDHSAFVVVAATGVYLSPVLMQAAPDRLMDVVIYYSAWSLLFSYCALNEGRRITYMLPMVFALIGFDAVWRTSGETAWQLAVWFQAIQLVVFAVTAAAFTVIHRRPLAGFDAAVHGFALIYFYGLEYMVLKRHVPQLAPVVGIGSAALLLAIYFIARAALKQAEHIGAGAVIVSTYCSVAVVHAVFFEWMPQGLFVWAALLAAIIVGITYTQLPNQSSPAFKPVLIITGLLFGFSYLALLMSGNGRTNVVMPTAALAIYAATLYAGYYLFTRLEGATAAAPILLYAAHFAVMVCASQAIGTGMGLSIGWAVLAVAVMIVAMLAKDKLLGQSALLIFAAAGVKVLLHDLSASGSLPRVLTLIVLAVSLYAGGWLYQSLARSTED